MVNEVTNPTTSLREVSGWTDIIDESVHTSVNVLWLSISEETFKANYERDATPDPIDILCKRRRGRIYWYSVERICKDGAKV
jgi:hypothetical protein